MTVNNTSTAYFRQWRQWVLSLGAGILLAAGFASTAHAASYANLAAVKPAISCDQLAKADVKTADGGKVTIKTASVRDTDKGPYCRVTGSVDPGINFAGDLPLAKWTQRFLQGAQGREGIVRGGSCTPALNGEIAVVTVGGGGGGGGGEATSDSETAKWGVGPQGRINSAYLGQHMTAVAFKAVIRAFYGQPPKYSYLVGCSGGGGTSLNEAQRYPEDFDGYSIGAPPLYLTVHDVGFWHGWEYHANQRADGSVVLAKEKLPILHDAVIQHCGQVSGLMDNELQQPTLCKFDKSWVQCPAGASDTSKCLSAEEANVAEQLYLGPNDGKNFFEPSGFPPGSELNWRLSTTGNPADREGANPRGLHMYIMPPLSGQSTKDIMAQFTFTQDWYDKTVEMRPLFNSGNTNLRPLAKSGGKIILWNGAEDNVVQPAGTIAYYEAVKKELGEKLTDSVVRFFLLPGVGHCGGGDGANQIDILTPLMAWVETNQAPMVIVAGKPVPQTRTGGGGAGQRPGAVPAYPPYAEPDEPTLYTRPEYPFPNVAQYKGAGDPNDAANYQEVRGPMTRPQAFTNEAIKLIGANNQKWYKAENGQLVVVPKP
jgi:feruloyl esterase